MEHTPLVDLPWSDAWLVGHSTLDLEHRELVAAIERVLRASDAAQGLCAVSAFIDHAQSHFAAEEQLMVTHQFPAAGCHADEHAKVLESAKDVESMLRNGDDGMLSDFADALAAWFPAHAEQMDSAIASWISKKKGHGAPVVLRRLIFDR